MMLLSTAMMLLLLVGGLFYFRAAERTFADVIYVSDLAIAADGLSKRYRLGTGAHRYGRLTESLSNAFAAPFRKLSRRDGPSPSQVPVGPQGRLLRGEAGEAVGIIGRNGAGKTTFLKVLSRITEPTEGRAVLDGRVGSLLEVGTGFHPELTGRENVYLEWRDPRDVSGRHHETLRRDRRIR